MSASENQQKVDPLLERYFSAICESLHTKNPGDNLTLRSGTFPIKGFQRGRIKYVDLSGYRYITQNPNKNSKWAELARRGHKIMWVINLNTNAWLYRVVDNQVTKL